MCCESRYVARLNRQLKQMVRKTNRMDMFCQLSHFWVIAFDCIVRAFLASEIEVGEKRVQYTV